jgi:precorrin-2/cobalt-factor-2 C20-methyltransferase
MAKLYGIGVGVGDPELITLKAIRKIKELDVIILPEAKNIGESTAYTIAKEYMKEDVQKVAISFKMKDSWEERREDHKANAVIVNELLDAGKNVGFLTIGDPMTYSTFVYIMELLKDGVDVETVPGITSFASITARVNMPLVMGDESIKVVGIAKETDIIKEIDSADNIIFMKVVRNLERLKEALKETGNMNNVVLISNCGKEDEKIIYDLENIEKDDISYFSTMILKKGGIEKWKRFTS